MSWLQSPGAKQLHRRKANALLMALGGLGIVVAGNIAADIEPVADRGQPAEQLPVPEDRPHQPEIVEVRAALIGIVEQEGIARLEPAVARHLVDHRLDREGHGTDEDRQAIGALHQRVAGDGVVEPVAGVARLGDDRVEGRAEQRRVHLVGDLFEPALQDGQSDRIDAGHAASSVLAAAFTAVASS